MDSTLFDGIGNLGPDSPSSHLFNSFNLTRCAIKKAVILFHSNYF